MNKKAFLYIIFVLILVLVMVAYKIAINSKKPKNEVIVNVKINGQPLTQESYGFYLLDDPGKGFNLIYVPIEETIEILGGEVKYNSKDDTYTGTLHGTEFKMSLKWNRIVTEYNNATQIFKTAKNGYLFYGDGTVELSGISAIVKYGHVSHKIYGDNTVVVTITERP